MNKGVRSLLNKVRGIINSNMQAKTGDLIALLNPSSQAGLTITTCRKLEHVLQGGFGSLRLSVALRAMEVLSEIQGEH